VSRYLAGVKEPGYVQVTGDGAVYLRLVHYMRKLQTRDIKFEIENVDELCVWFAAGRCSTLFGLVGIEVGVLVVIDGLFGDEYTFGKASAGKEPGSEPEDAPEDAGCS